MGENEIKGKRRKVSDLRNNLINYIKPDKIMVVKEKLDYIGSNSTNISITQMTSLLSDFIGYEKENIEKYLKNWPFEPQSKAVRYLDANAAKKLYEYFSEDVPLYLDVDRFLKSMILGSELLFRSSNLKLCLAVMTNRFKIGYEWSIDEIVHACSNYVNTNKLTPAIVQECLDKYCVGKSFHQPLPNTPNVIPLSQKIDYALFKKLPNNKYQLRLTELIAHYNNYLKTFQPTLKR
jgi:hypothetical protein